MYNLTAGTKLILASSSPRRRELLNSLGVSFDVISPDVDESEISGEPPRLYVERLALAKAKAVAVLNRNAYVVGSDTTVVLSGKIYGKPSSPQEAVEMISCLQGSVHEVFSGCALVNASKSIESVQSSRTAVQMRKLTKAEISAYVRSGESMDKAGAYAMQGIGASLVVGIDGSYTNVVGLDLVLLTAMLRDFGAITI